MKQLILLIASCIFLNLLEAAIDPDFSSMSPLELKRKIKELHDQCIKAGAPLSAPKVDGTPIDLKREATRLKKELEKLAPSGITSVPTGPLPPSTTSSLSVQPSSSPAINPPALPPANASALLSENQPGLNAIPSLVEVK